MVALSHAIEDSLSKPVRSAKLNVSMYGQVHVEDHVGQDGRKTNAAKESIYPLVVEAVEVLEVVNCCEKQINVTKERFFNVGLSVPRHFEGFMS